jgi:hypothetical protein
MNMGFGVKGREFSELEKELDIKLVGEENEPFSVYTNKMARIFVGGGASHGVYRGLNDRGFLVLFPSAVSESYPTSPDGEKCNTIYLWNEESPTFVKFEASTGIGPVREEYVKWIVENWGRDVPNLERKGKE